MRVMIKGITPPRSFVFCLRYAQPLTDRSEQLTLFDVPCGKEMVVAAE